MSEEVFREAFIATIKMARHGETCKVCILAAIDKYSYPPKTGVESFCDTFQELNVKIGAAMSLLDDESREEIKALLRME